MTPSQRQSLIRVARSCAKAGSWGALVGWVENFDARPRLPQEMPGNGPKRACERVSGDPGTPQPPDTLLRRFMRWWYE